MFGGGAVATWLTAAASGSRFPIWPAYGFSLVAVIGLYMCFAVLHGWWPARRPRTAAPLPSPSPAIIATARKDQLPHDSAPSSTAIRDLIMEGKAMQARIGDRRGPFTTVPDDLQKSFAAWKTKVSALLASQGAGLLAQFEGRPLQVPFAVPGLAGVIYDKIEQGIRLLEVIKQDLEKR